MKKTTRKLRSDSATADIKAFESLNTKIDPPNPLTPEEMRYWEAIICARAKEDWTTIDLMHAWNLSKQLWLIELSYQEIAEKGLTLVNERGTQIDNPAFSRLEKLSRLATSLSAKLHVHAEATVGKSEDAAKRATKQRKAKQSIENVIQSPTLSDFIATRQ